MSEMSREEALAILRKENGVVYLEYEEAVDVIEKALADRPHGEWIEKHCDYGVYYRCSNCHKMPPNYECDYKEGAIRTNFCPNCGADMRVKNELNRVSKELNSEIEKSKSEIVPDYRDGWKLKEGDSDA